MSVFLLEVILSFQAILVLLGNIAIQKTHEGFQVFNRPKKNWVQLAARNSNKILVIKASSSTFNTAVM